MDKAAIKDALNQGQNLVVSGRKVWLLIEINDRPTNNLTIASLDSGTKYVTSSDRINAVVGRVDTTLLPWNAGKADSDQDEPASAGYPYPFTTAKGESVKPGDTVRLVSGDTATYLGTNPNAQIPPEHQDDDWPKGWPDHALHHQPCPGPRGLVSLEST